MTALDGASARVHIPALDGDPGLAAMFSRRDYTPMAARAAAGRICVRGLALDTRRQERPLLAGLSVYASTASRVDALVVWAVAAGDVALEPDGDNYRGDVLLLSGVLAGLLPGLDASGLCGGPPGPLDAAEEELTEAGLRVADLALHRARGTRPDYLPGGMSVQDAMAAEETDAAFALRELAAQWAAWWDGGSQR